MLTLLSTNLYLPTYVNHAVLTAEHTPLSPKHPLSLTQMSNGMVVDSMVTQHKCSICGWNDTY